MNIFGGIIYALGASGEEQPWSTGSIPVKDQWRFETSQILFRQNDSCALSSVTGEDNPVFNKESDEELDDDVFTES